MHIETLNTAELSTIVNGAEALHDNIPSHCSRGMRRVANGEIDAYDVRDMWDANLNGRFTRENLLRAWNGIAHGAGYGDGIAYAESGEADAVTYSTACEIAIFGEVVYS